MMKSYFKDEEIMVIVVLKWLFLAILAGALTGTVVGGFLLILFKGIVVVDALPPYKYILLPLGMLASVFVITKICPAAAGHGTDRVIAAIHDKWGRIPDMVVPVKIVSTWMTLIPGGVVGTEGPSTQIGGALMSWVSDLLKCNEHTRRKLVVCGVAAALSAVFGAPVAGAVFGIEVLFVGEMFYTALLPAVVSGAAAHYVCTLMGVPYIFPHVAIPAFSAESALWSIGAAMFFALVSILHVGCFDAMDKIYKKLPLDVWMKALLSSAILLSTVPFFNETYLGMGERGLTAFFAGQGGAWYAFALKSFLLAVTLAGGGSGGVLTPTFYIGAASGALFASIFGLDSGFFAVLGFVGLIAASVNTPLSAIILSMEMFGADMAPYAALTAVFAYMLSGNRSLYPSQIRARPKSEDFVLMRGADRRRSKAKGKKQ